MAPSSLRAKRLADIKRLKAQKMSSAQIGRELGLAPSTVRDYLTDPSRERAQKRQRSYTVDPEVQLPLGPITHARQTRGFTPHKGKGLVHNAARSRQQRALVGYYSKRGR